MMTIECLIIAIQTKDIPRVQEILGKSDVDINAVDQYQSFPLCYAVTSGEIQICELLIQYGANVHYSDGGSRLLQIAVRNSQGTEMLQWLVDKGLDIKAVINNYGSKAFYQAVKGDINVSVLKWLVDKGLDIKAVNRYGSEALNLVIQNGNTEALKYLLENGADTTYVDEWCGCTVFHYAAALRTPEILELLLSEVCANNKAAINAIDMSGDTALHKALKSSQQTLLKMYSVTSGKISIDGRYNINVIDSTRQVFLHITFPGALTSRDVFIEKINNMSIVSDKKGGKIILNIEDTSMNGGVFTIEKYDGSELCIFDKAGNVLLDLSVSKIASLVNLLIQNGADIMIADGYGNTVLHCAALNGHVDVLEFFHNTGAIAIDAFNDYGQTPLHMAVGMGYLEVVEFLLNNGADIMLADEDGNTMLHYAALNGHVDVLEFFHNTGAIAIDTLNKDGRTPLHAAVDKGDPKVVEFLLNRGADIMLADKNGNVMLHYALQNKNFDLVPFLLARGGGEAIDTLNKDGCRPLDYICSPCVLDDVDSIVKDFNYLYNLFDPQNPGVFYQDNDISLEARWAVFRKYYKSVNQEFPLLWHFKAFLNQDTSITGVWKSGVVARILDIPSEILNAEIEKYPGDSSKIYDSFNLYHIINHSLPGKTKDVSVKKVLESKDLMWVISEMVGGGCDKLISSIISPESQSGFTELFNYGGGEDETKEDMPLAALVHVEDPV